MSKASMFQNLKDLIAKHYGDNVGKMLIHTGVIGWILSAAAQVVAIVINDKIPKEQKMFLVPQEMADAAVNIVSFYLITQTFASVAGKLVKSGKWLPGAVRDFFEKGGLADKLGKKGFDVTANGNLPKDLQKKYDKFHNGIDVIATTLGSILSCNIVTPLVRNEIAADRQKRGIARMNAKNPETKPLDKPSVSSLYQKVTLKDFQALSSGSIYNNSGSLKI